MTTSFAAASRGAAPGSGASPDSGASPGAGSASGSGVVPVSAWPDLTMGAALIGGHRNTVYAGLLGEDPVVIRHSGRPEASLQWEFDLLEHLREHGMLVPETIPAADGRQHVDGWHVQHRFAGRPLEESAHDAAALRSALRTLHASTAGWPQRPGSRSARDLLTEDRGADVDLRAMPADLRSTIRSAWAALDPVAPCVIHGDAGGSNALLLPNGGCALLDWDESRVDDPQFDPGDHTGPQQDRAMLGLGDRDVLGS